MGVGSKVLLKSHPLSNLNKKFSAKLAPRWRGPYIVAAQLSPVTFSIKDEDAGETRIAHVDQLKEIEHNLTSTNA